MFVEIEAFGTPDVVEPAARAQGLHDLVPLGLGRVFLGQEQSQDDR